MAAIPRQLKQGDEIGIIAPASSVLEAELEPGIQLLETFGHKVVLAPHLYDQKDYMAGEDEVRLEDLHAMFSDNRVRAIICARGGYGTLRILDKVDYGLIRAHPKIFVGFSDITALLLAIHKKTGLVTFHGPVIRELSKRSIGNLESLLNLVCNDGLLELELAGGKPLKPGKAEGVLMGGNLSLLCHMVGSSFIPSFKGAILFVEERGEDLYRIDRMLTHLRLSGLLGEISGLMVGAFEDCGDRADLDRLLLEVASGLDIPVINGLPVGHGLVNISLPIGLPAIMDSETMTLKISKPSVSS